MALVNGARTPGVQYFHKERYFTGPEDSLEYTILTISRPSFGPQLGGLIYLNSRMEQREISAEITLSKKHLIVN